MTNLLAEIKENEAVGAVAAIFGEIRHATGLPLVNLVYRHLAAVGRLESVWPLLRPNLESPAIDDLANSLVYAPRNEALLIPGEVLAAVGVDDRWLERARATFRAYEYANTRNILLILALLNGCPGTLGVSGMDARRPPSFGGLLPIADLSTVPIPVSKMLEHMSRLLIVSTAPNVLVPSLLRHYASQPAALGLMWVAALPAIEHGLAEAVHTTRERARRLARRLPYPVHRSSDATARSALARFSGAVATMIVAGALLEATLFGQVDDQRQLA